MASFVRVIFFFLNIEIPLFYKHFESFASYNYFTFSLC